MSVDPGAPDIPGLTFVSRIGSGGYADVYQYEQQLPRMPVAVKVLKGEGLTDAVRAQFTAEADTMAQLADHPYIVQVFRAGVADGDRPYLVMKYYPPPNVAVRVRQRRFTVQEVLRMGIQLASAVETAHRAGITHRDIKPANVLLTQYGDPGLTDFGIAGRGAADESDEDRGVSVPWAAPEVLFGHSAGDAAADVYGLAATLWHLLVGRSPFEVPGEDNSTYALMPRIRSSPVPSTRRPDVPVALDRLLQQAMAKQPAVRPRSAMAFARALQQVEQEARFGRTQIVVLDEQGHQALDSGARQATDSDATRFRAPQQVSAQPDATTRARQRADAETQPAARATPGRPTSPRGRTDPDVEATSFRRGTADGEPSGARARRIPVLTTVVGVLAVLAVVLLAIQVWPRGETPEPAPTPVNTVAGEPDDNAIGDPLPGQPTVEAHRQKKAVAFQWSYANQRGSDNYQVAVGRSEAAVNRATRTDTYRTARTPEWRTTGPQGRPWCVKVRVVTDRGVAGPWSTAVCRKAR